MHLNVKNMFMKKGIDTISKKMLALFFNNF